MIATATPATVPAVNLDRIRFAVASASERYTRAGNLLSWKEDFRAGTQISLAQSWLQDALHDAGNPKSGWFAVTLGKIDTLTADACRELNAATTPAQATAKRKALRAVVQANVRVCDAILAGLDLATGITTPRRDGDPD
jgi:hypothetical protein